ncbi:unnamed protein product, partial [Mesorhabditis spiculigera]
MGRPSPGLADGSEAVFDNLEATVPWRSERRQMYDRVVDVPRLVCFYAENQPLPDALLTEAKDALSSHCRRTPVNHSPRRVCVSIATVPTALPGTGTTRDEVAPRTRWWPSCLSVRLARSYCALVGAANPSFNLGHGDLLVMGGSCQRTWEHCVPKSGGPSGRESAFNSALAELDSVAGSSRSAFPLSLPTAVFGMDSAENNPTRLLVRRQSLADVRDQ